MSAEHPGGHGRPGQLSSAANLAVRRIKERLESHRYILGILSWHIKIGDTTTVNQDGTVVVEWATFHLYVQCGVWTPIVRDALMAELQPIIQQDFPTSSLVIYRLNP